jgi:hypothetical protein
MSDPYAGWALTMLDRFFGLHMAAQRARLVVTKGLLDEEYPHLGGSAGFLNAVIRGPRFLSEPREGAANFHSHAQRLYHFWKHPVYRPESCFSLPDEAPLYLPHLAALCLGWTVNPDDADLAPNAFYERLATILPKHGMNWVELGQWRKLWDGLERWTCQLDGRRGVFVVEVLGHYSNVGIPLSQVLLTQSKIANLPELFVTTGLASRWEKVDADYLRRVLVSYESQSRAALGGMLFRELRNEESDIGKATLSRLLEFLSEQAYRIWPPRDIALSASVSTGRNARAPSVQVLLVLEAVDQPASWRCRFGVLGSEPPNASPEGAGWSFVKVDERLGGLWLGHNDHSGDKPIDAGQWTYALEAGLSIECQPPAGYDEQAITLRLPGRRIRIFQETGWIGQRLVEEDGLPTSGGCFLLIASSALAELEAWLSIFSDGGGVVTDYTRSGLPSGSRLVHLAGLEHIEDCVLQNFPERSIARKSANSCIYLRGGSQVQGTGKQNVYLPYDPPDVVLLAPAQVSLDCVGATLVEDSASSASWKVPEGLPGLEPRQFRLEIAQEEMQVRITAVSSECSWIPQSIGFAVGREAVLGANFPEDARVRFDRFGARTNDSGILGGIIDQAAWTHRTPLALWNFEDRQIDLGTPATYSDLDHVGWCLLESLAQTRRVTGQEFSRRCDRILNWWPRYAWSEARWLRALCHIEVERDNRGRIAYVHPIFPHAYLLPYKKDNKWLTVLGGCPTRASLRNFLEASQQLGVEVFVTERSSPLTPPRWLCCSEDFTAIQLALSEAEFAIATNEANPIPLSAEIAEWSASMEDWRSTLLWLDGVPPTSESVFNPRRFQMSATTSFSCPYKLIAITDNLNEKHRWHLLHYNGGLQGEPEYAFLLDPSWGKWLSMSKIASEFAVYPPDEEDAHTPLPFEVAKCRLHVPASLVFPTMLSRALLCSSGLVPFTAHASSPYYDNHACCQFTPREEPAYRGACHIYSDLHPAIAQTLTRKLDIRLFDVTDETH